MNRTRGRWLSLIAAVLAVMLVYGLYEAQKQQLRAENTIAVVAAGRFIEAGTRIEERDVMYISLPDYALSGDMLRDGGLVIGKEALVPIGQAEPILSWKLNEYVLLPGKHQSTFQIPPKYIESIASGIRAGDKVWLYVSGEEESARLFEEVVTVASVRTAGNLEVDNIEQPHLLALAEGNKEQLYTSRRDANGMIDAVNLNLTNEQWIALDELCSKGQVKLVIAYSPESMQIAEGKGE